MHCTQTNTTTSPATLVLLIAISALVIGRTFILRRRQQRLIEEAIRNGTYVPPSTNTGSPKFKKPMLWDVHLEAGESDDVTSEDADVKEKEKEKKQEVEMWDGFTVRTWSCVVRRVVVRMLIFWWDLYSLSR